MYAMTSLMEHGADQFDAAADSGPVHELTDLEIDSVSGGFVCAGLCIAAAAGTAFLVGTAVGFFATRAVLAD